MKNRHRFMLTFEFSEPVSRQAAKAIVRATLKGATVGGFSKKPISYLVKVPISPSETMAPLPPPPEND